MGEVERPGVTRDVSCPRTRVACGNRGRPTMQRRKFMIGMGSLTAGGAAALGSGATSITQDDRNVSVDVVADDYGVLALEDTSQGGIVNQTGNTLEIDFAEYNGSAGVSVGAEIILGEINGISDIGDNGNTTEPAFQIRNQAPGMDLNFAFEYELDNPDSLNSDGSVLAFYPFANTHYYPLVVAEGSDDHVSGGTYRIDGFLENNDPLQPGDAVDMAVAIDTANSNSSTSEDFSGSLTIIAEPDN